MCGGRGAPAPIASPCSPWMMLPSTAPSRPTVTKLAPSRAANAQSGRSIPHLCSHRSEMTELVHSPAALWEMAVQPSGAPAVRRYGLRGFPRLPDPYAEVNRERRRIMRLFGHTRRDDVDFYWLRNPARSGRLTAMRLNEPETAPSRVQDLGQTNPSHCRHAGISPNEPEAVQADEHHFGETNPSPHKPAHTVVAEQTRAAAERREFARVACAGRVGQRSRLAWLRRHNPLPVTVCTAAPQARCVLWRTRLPATASPRGYRVAGHRGETD